MGLDLLHEIEKLSPSMRRLRLGHGDTRAAVAALGTDAGIAWLEAHIDSPVGPEWGQLLFELGPTWHHLDRWIRLSKVHCLAAVDAILRFASQSGAAKSDFRFPDGADSVSIDGALTLALSLHANHRLHDAIKRIRFAWSIGPHPRHGIQVPQALEEAAALLFDGDAGLLVAWHDSMATAMDAVNGSSAVWNALLEFAESRKFVAIVDWRDTESVVWGLRQLHPAKALNIPWAQFETVNLDVDMDTLLRQIGWRVINRGVNLVALLRGSDDYPLTFLPTNALSEMASLLRGFEDESMGVESFQ